MRPLLVDTNILLDLVTDDANWAGWSQQQLERHALSHRLIINPVIYAELSIGFDSIEALDAMLKAAGLEMEALPPAALFLAGKVFRLYRRNGGKGSVLPDFFIGAHAAVADIPLLSRDKGRFKSYFPSVTLITPP